MKKSSQITSKKQTKEKIQKEQLKEISGGSDQRNKAPNAPKYDIKPTKPRRPFGGLS